MTALPPGAHRIDPVDFVVLDALRCYWQELPPGPIEGYLAGFTGQDTTQGIVVDFNGCVMGEIRGGLHSSDIAAGTAATSFGFLRSPLSNT